MTVMRPNFSPVHTIFRLFSRMSKIKKASATVGAHHQFWCGIFRGPQIHLQSGSHFEGFTLKY